MIKLFGLYLNQLPDRRSLAALLDRQMYASWREKHKSVRDELATRASLGGIFLLQKMGYRHHLAYDANGRPFFLDSPIDFNITHSEQIVICAAEAPDESDKGDKPFCRVGVDVENLARIASVRICPLAERWFTPSEHDIFLSDPTDATFLRIWTRKEALIKWTGEGLRSMRKSDTTMAEKNYGILFREYRVENTLVTLCHRADALPPDTPHMLTNSELFD